MRTRYFVTRTGFEMADVCHAYGVAELLQHVHVVLGREPDPPIEIRDLGHAWEIGAARTDIDPKLAERVAKSITAPLANQPERGQDAPPPGWFVARGWNYLYVTNQAKDKATAAQRLRAALPRVVHLLSERDGDVMALYRTEEVTTPQGLETAGGKGSRSAARNVYAEKQWALPEDLWAVAAVGAMAVGTFLWPRQGQGNAAIVPVPQQVRYENHLEIRDETRAWGILCSASTTTAIAHYAAKLAQRVAQREADTTGWESRYSAVAYEGMSRTGQRPKPAHGGLFPMDLFNEIIAQDPEAAIALFTVWDKLLQVGGFKGMETLALSLTEFLMHPTLRNLERHWRVHLRFSLRDESDSKRVRTFYPEQATKGLMTHVTA